MQLLDRFYGIWLGISAFFLLVGVPFIFVRKEATAVLVLITMVALLYFWRMSRKGEPRQSLLLFSACMWLMLVGLLYAGLPPYSAAPAATVALTLSVVVSVRMGAWYGLAYVLAWLVYVLLQMSPWAWPPYFRAAPLTGWLIGAAAVWLILLPTPLMLQKLRDSRAMLRSVIEAGNDGLLVVNQDGLVETFNQRFLAMWHLSPDLGRSAGEAPVMAQLELQMLAPHMFAQKVRELQGMPDASTMDLVRTRDGRTLECHSEPVRQDGRLTGRVWSFRDVTERERAQASLQRVKEQLEGVLNATPESIFLVDRRALIHLVNDIAAERVGRTTDQLLGRCALDFFPPEVAQSRAASLEQVFATGKSLYVEDARSGRDFALSYHPVHDQHGGVPFVAVFAAEISERKRTETQLRAREARLSSLLASLQDTMVVLDDQGTVLEFLQAVPGEHPSFNSLDHVVLGKSVRELMAVDVAQRFLEVLHSLRDGAQPRSFDYSVGSGGRRFDYVATISRIADGSGYLCVVRDVSARQAQRRAIDRLARRNKLLLDSVGEGIIDVGMDGLTTFANPAAQRMLGLEESQMVGQHPHRVFHHHRADGAPYPLHECPIHRSLADGLQRHDDSEWFWRSDGTGFPVLVTVTPVVEDGTRVGVVVVFRDITERKRAEAEVHLLAFHDALTKLPNRRLLLDRIEQQMAACRRSGEVGALLFLDLDNFKPLNDAHGHAAGDLLLVEVARRVGDSVREIDTVARFGGDEFTVLLANLGTDAAAARAHAMLVAEKIRVALAQDYHVVIPRDDGRDQHVHHKCTASIGVCLLPLDFRSADDVIEAADAAMYTAKESGRNAVRCAER